MNTTCNLPFRKSETMRVLGLSLMIPFVMLIVVASRNPSFGKELSSPSLKVVREISTRNDVRPIWCFDESPKFIFFDERVLFLGSPNGQLSKMAEFDRAADDASLVCSKDARTILFLSGGHDRVYIIEGGIHSEYELNPPYARGLRFGSLMSPDGTTIALPGNVRLLRGPDVLKRKRVIQTSTAEVFWTKRHILQNAFKTAGHNRFSVLSFIDLSSEGTIELAVPGAVNGVFECGEDQSVVLFSDEADTRYVSRLTKTLSVGPALVNAETIGEISTSDGSCLISIYATDRLGIDRVSMLALLATKLRLIDVSSHVLMSNLVSHSKDFKYFITFQPLRIGEREGRIIVFEAVVNQ